MKNLKKFSSVVFGAAALMLASQAPAALEDNLLLYLNFNETSGTTLADSTASGLNADVIGTGVLLGQTGVAGSAAECPGTATDFIVIDNNPGNASPDALPAALDFAGPFSISVWISFPAAPTGGAVNHYLMGSCDWTAAGAARRGIGFIRKNGNDDLMRAYDDAGSYPLVFALEEMFDGEAYDGFHHYVLTSDGNSGNVIWYRNNVSRINLIGAAPTGGFGGTAPWTFGANAGTPTAAIPDRAVFDEFAVWNRALTATEVGDIFAAGQAGNPLPLTTSVDSWEMY